MLTALKIALFGGTLTTMSMVIVFLVGFHVITISDTMANFTGALMIVGLFLITAGLVKGLGPPK